MISVCIPVYNFEITRLVSDLDVQGRSLNVPFEIVLIDDCSSEEFRTLNGENFRNHRSVLLPENVGRSKIRNLFKEYAKHEKLLFLDCDSAIISDTFLGNYVEAVGKCGSDVICGGSIYPEDPPVPGRRLRWKYGMIKESRPARIRRDFPGKYFMGNNFLIDTRIFDKVSFDERISEYGYEDTLFAWQLQKNGTGFCHIDNPVLNLNPDDNHVFMDKTDKALENLVNILIFTGYDRSFIESVTILNLCYRIRESGLKGIISPLMGMVTPLLRFLLQRGFANIRLFDIYRLGVLVSKKGLCRK